MTSARPFAMGVLAVGAGLAWGLAAGVYHIFPYSQARALQNAVMSASPYARQRRAVRDDAAATARGMELADWDTRAQIVMIGDSIVEFAPWKDMFPEADILNRGAAGDTVGGVDARLDLILRAKPESAFLLAGTNDLKVLNPVTGVLARYRRSIERLRAAGVTTYIQSLPACSDEFSFCTRERRQLEDEFNAGLERIAAETGATYIDLAKRFPRSKDYRPDGVHMNTAGHKAWRDILAPYIAGASRAAASRDAAL